jgi:hypothetical protein
MWEESNPSEPLAGDSGLLVDNDIDFGGSDRGFEDGEDGIVEDDFGNYFW